MPWAGARPERATFPIEHRMLIEESTHHDLEITRLAKQVAKLVEPQLSLRLKRRDGDMWLAALNDRRAQRLRRRDQHAIAVEGLFDLRAVLEALMFDEVGRGLVTADARRAAGNLRQLATLAAHQRPESRRPEAVERAHALGARVLRGAGIPESALTGSSRKEVPPPHKQIDEPAPSKPSPESEPQIYGDPASKSSRPPEPQPDACAASPTPPGPTNPSQRSRETPETYLLVPTPRASAQLAWRVNPQLEELVLLEPGQRPYVLGREFDCDVLLDEDPGVSRRHAQVFYEDNNWWLTDLGSKNGSQVGSTRVSATSRLTDGVTVTVGRTDLRFELIH